ncbi:MAG: ElyC/SanA/YdcF family protein [Caldimonas sp.]
MLPLFRRRQVWIPTVWSTLLLLTLVTLAVIWMAHHAYAFLAPTEPARGRDGTGARTLVVEGWLDAAELDQAIAATRRGRYRQVVVSGGPFDDWPDGQRFANYADRAADYLRRHGLDALPVAAVPAPASAQDRTYLSALVIRDWAARTGTTLEAIDLFSSGVHAYRSRIVFRMALGPDVEVGVIAARPLRFEADRWWTTSAGTKAVIGEALSVAWTRCCFWPAPHGSFSERWGIPEPAR